MGRGIVQIQKGATTLRIVTIGTDAAINTQDFMMKLGRLAVARMP